MCSRSRSSGGDEINEFSENFVFLLLEVHFQVEDAESSVIRESPLQEVWEQLMWGFLMTLVFLIILVLLFP